MDVDNTGFFYEWKQMQTYPLGFVLPGLPYHKYHNPYFKYGGLFSPMIWLKKNWITHIFIFQYPKNLKWKIESRIFDIWRRKFQNTEHKLCHKSGKYPIIVPIFATSDWVIVGDITNEDRCQLPHFRFISCSFNKIISKNNVRFYLDVLGFYVCKTINTTSIQNRWLSNIDTPTF